MDSKENQLFAYLNLFNTIQFTWIRNKRWISQEISTQDPDHFLWFLDLELLGISCFLRIISRQVEIVINYYSHGSGNHKRIYALVITFTLILMILRKFFDFVLISGFWGCNFHGTFYGILGCFKFQDQFRISSRVISFWSRNQLLL